jgi:RNA polymerase sigma-70 factor (ECF subfamily)
MDEEREIIKQAQTDPEVFGRIFDAYYPKIFNYCLRRVQNRQVAEDLTSEIFFKALNNLKKFQWQNVPFGAWLFRIASNEVINYYRKGLNKTTSLDQLQESIGFDAGGSENAATELMEQEQQKERFAAFAIIQEKVKLLPEHYREALSLRYFEKFSITDIAQILDKPEGTVKSLLSRGTDLLQAELAAQPSVAPVVVSNESRN